MWEFSFWLDAVGLKVRVGGSGFAATSSQRASGESGVPFESLGSPFALNILLRAFLHNDQTGHM